MRTEDLLYETGFSESSLKRMLNEINEHPYDPQDSRQSSEWLLPGQKALV
jgi:hypothetical protein